MWLQGTKEGAGQCRSRFQKILGWTGWFSQIQEKDKSGCEAVFSQEQQRGLEDMAAQADDTDAEASQA